MIGKVPCDICNEEIPFKEYPDHIKSHNNLASKSTINPNPHKSSITKHSHLKQGLHEPNPPKNEFSKPGPPKNGALKKNPPRPIIKGAATVSFRGDTGYARTAMCKLLYTNSFSNYYE